MSNRLKFWFQIHTGNVFQDRSRPDDKLDNMIRILEEFREND